MREVERARAVLADLEASRHAGRIDAMPLFTYEPPSAEAPPDAVREALERIDPDVLSPREAQAALYELKRVAKGLP